MRSFLALTLTGFLVAGSTFYLGMTFQARRDGLLVREALRISDEALTYAETAKARCLAAFDTKNIYHEPPVMTLAQSLAGHGYDVPAIRALICGR